MTTTSEKRQGNERRVAKHTDTSSTQHSTLGCRPVNPRSTAGQPSAVGWPSPFNPQLSSLNPPGGGGGGGGGGLQARHRPARRSPPPPRAANGCPRGPPRPPGRRGGSRSKVRGPRSKEGGRGSRREGEGAVGRASCRLSTRRVILAMPPLASLRIVATRACARLSVRFSKGSRNDRNDRNDRADRRRTPRADASAASECCL